MTRFPSLPLLAALAALAAVSLPARAADEPLPFRYAVRADWTLNKYGKDVNDCWNDGVAARCGGTPTRVEAENEARLMFDRELSDLVELRAQLGVEGYYRNGWTERSSRATGENVQRPTWVAHPMDSWIGLHHEDWGTVRIGTGLNPFQQASGQMDGNTDVGGREYLERMIAYDSPLLVGDKATGASLNLVLYDGSRYRKARYERAPEDSRSAARAKGISLLLDGKIGGKVGAKLAFYTERYGARKFYGVGPLDGSYELVPGGGATSPQYNEDNPALTSYAGSGTRARSRGVAADLVYEGDSFKLGGQLLMNRRLRTTGFTNPQFEADGYGTGYATDGVALYFSTWSGPWSLWSKAYTMKFRLTDAGQLNTTSDWLYANSTYRSSKIGGEVGYALTEHVKAILGAEWMKRDFTESPLAGGACATGKVNPCYDPKGYKFFTGVRSNF